MPRLPVGRGGVRFVSHEKKAGCTQGTTHEARVYETLFHTETMQSAPAGVGVGMAFCLTRGKKKPLEKLRRKLSKDGDNLNGLPFCEFL